jgi:hypothetical protein
VIWAWSSGGPLLGWFKKSSSGLLLGWFKKARSERLGSPCEGATSIGIASTGADASLLA